MIKARMQNAARILIAALLASATAFALPDTPSLTMNDALGAPSLFPSVQKFDYHLMIGSTYRFSSTAGGVGDMTATALNGVDYFFSDSITMTLFAGYQYRPFMTRTHGAFGDPLENQTLLGGAKFLWTPSANTSLALAYGYTDDAFNLDGRAYYFNRDRHTFETITSEMLQNRVQALFKHKFGDHFSIVIDADFFIPTPTSF